MFDTFATPGWAQETMGKDHQLTEFGTRVHNVLKSTFRKAHETEDAGLPMNQEPLLQHSSNNDVEPESRTIDENNEYDGTQDIVSEYGEIEDSESSSNTNSGESDGTNEKGAGNVEEANTSYENEVVFQASAPHLIALKNVSEIKALDVLPVYPDPSSSDPYWLFMVAKVDKKCVSGRWFKSTENSLAYSLAYPDKIRVSNIIRLTSGFDNVYVLPQHNVMDKSYVLPQDVHNMLEREIKSLLA